MKKLKIHYASKGEWGQDQVYCHRYFTTDVIHTEKQEEVTCKFCLRMIQKNKEQRYADQINNKKTG